MESPNLFVITGGPGSGKTTVLLELQKRGLQFAPEVARQIIQEQVRTGGKALPWENRELYTNLMLERSIESYKAHTQASKATFSDRGIPDTLGYSRLIGLADAGFIRSACDEYRYAHVSSLLRHGKVFTKPTMNANRISMRQNEPASS
jgi:predicted ATPase